MRSTSKVSRSVMSAMAASLVLSACSCSSSEFHDLAPLSTVAGEESSYFTLTVNEYGRLIVHFAVIDGDGSIEFHNNYSVHVRVRIDDSLATPRMRRVAWTGYPIFECSREHCPDFTELPPPAR